MGHPVDFEGIEDFLSIYQIPYESIPANLRGDIEILSAATAQLIGQQQQRSDAGRVDLEAVVAASNNLLASLN